MKKLQHQKGFSLLEVLIAVLILSIGLLGFARVEIIATRHNQTAYLQSLAQIQINSLAEQLRACGVNNPACLSQQINNWKNTCKTVLPGAQSEVNANGSDYIITLQWRPLPGNKKSITATSTMQVRL